MSHITLASHDKRATSPRLRPMGLGAPLSFISTKVGLGAIGLGGTDPYAPAPGTVRMSPVASAIGTGIVWGVIGGIAGAIRGDKAVKWGVVGLASGAAFGAVVNVATAPAAPPAK